MDLTGYPQTACIHLIASYLDDRSYTLCDSWSCLLAAFVGLHGCHCPWYWVNGIRYLPRSSLLPMRMGFFWHVMSTFSSLCIVTPSLVKMETLPSLAFFPTLIIEVGDSSNVSASADFLESCSNGSVVTQLPLQAPPLATPAFLYNILNIGRRWTLPQKNGQKKIRPTDIENIIQERRSSQWRRLQW